MNQDNVDILLIEDSPDYADLVQQWILDAEAGARLHLNWTDSLSAGLNRLSQGHVDVVLVDLGLPDSDGPETFFQVRRQAPSVPIIILSSADSESMALSLVRKGADDYLVKSACNGEALLRALHFALAREQWRGPLQPGRGGRRGRLLGILGGKGGMGTTTVACSLATELAAMPQQKTLLIDLDTLGGMVSFLLNLEAGNSIWDAIRKMDEMDLECWETIVTHRSAPELSVLPMHDQEDAAVTGEDAIRLLDWVRSIYDCVVVDLGRACPASLQLAEKMDEVCLVATAAIPALFETRRAATLLLKSGFEANCMHVILNQMVASSFTGNELQKVFGIQVYARLAADPREMEEAALARRVPDRRSLFGKDMQHLARKLAGVAEKPASRTAWLPAPGRWLYRRKAAALRSS